MPAQPVGISPQCSVPASPTGREGLAHCLCGALGGAVVVRAAVRVFRLALRDGLHGRVVQPAAHTVAAAAGGRRGPGAPNPSRCCAGEILGGKAFGIDAWRARGEWGQGVGPRGAVLGILATVRGLQRELAWRSGHHGAPEDLGSRHAVAGIGAAALLEQQQLELFARSVGLFGISIDETRRPLAVWGRPAAAW